MKLPHAATVVACAVYSVFAVSFSSCAGNASSSDFVAALEKSIDERRSEGRLRLERRIQALVEDNGLGNLRETDARAALFATAGMLEIASAAWWGWDAEDSTRALNAALAAPVDILVVPAMPGPWVVGPLFLKGPRVVLFEPGCEVSAIKGAFISRIACLLTIERRSGVIVSGYGSRLRMRKGDYTTEPYAPGQWRHAVAVRESQDILIEGLSIERSGGDGVYIGQKKGGAIPRNIVLRDLELSSHHRQGVSVIAADGFLMEYCRITGTRGTPPQAGIDFEPNSGVYGFTNCVVGSCVFRRNSGAAVHVHLAKMDASQPPVNIRVEDSALIGAPLAVWFRDRSRGATGQVEIADSAVHGLRSVAEGRGVTALIGSPLP